MATKPTRIAICERNQLAKQSKSGVNATIHQNSFGTFELL